MIWSEKNQGERGRGVEKAPGEAPFGGFKKKIENRSKNRVKPERKKRERGREITPFPQQEERVGTRFK